MAHPRHAGCGKAPENRTVCIELGQRLAIFAGGRFRRCCNGAAQRICHELASIADAKNGDAERKKRRVHVRGNRFINALRAAGENDADGGDFFDLGRGDGAGLDLAVHVLLAHTAGDQLAVLRAKVQNQNSFHYASSRNTMLPGSALSMMARECRFTPAARSLSPPPWKPFSTAQPIPTSSAPQPARSRTDRAALRRAPENRRSRARGRRDGSTPWRRAA